MKLFKQKPKEAAMPAAAAAPQFSPEIVAELGALYSPYLTIKDSMQFQPYLMSPLALDLRSKVINTDSSGYRTCIKQGRVISLDEFRLYEGYSGVTVGGSVVFGAAATSDQHTLGNRLNEHLSALVWNCGVGACNGIVEILSYIFLNKSVDFVIELSGANDLLLHLGSPRMFPRPFPFEGEDSFFKWNFGLPPRQKTPKSSDELDDFIALCKSLPAEPAAAELNMLVASSFVAERYRGCLDAIKTQVEIFRRIYPGNLVYILNPHLNYCKKTHEREDLYFRIALSRMPQVTRCMRLVMREMYPALRKDAREICREAGVTFLDANDLSFGDGICFIDDFHLTDLGFDLFARNLIEALPFLQGK